LGSGGYETLFQAFVHEREVVKQWCKMTNLHQNTPQLGNELFHFIDAIIIPCCSLEL
jgi:hypothetical protein